MPSWLLAAFEPFIKTYVSQRLALPQSAYTEIEADSAQYTADNQPLTADQLQAADRAIIDYVMGKVLSSKPLSTTPTA